MSVTVNCHVGEKTDVSRTYSPKGGDVHSTYGTLKLTEGYPGVTLFFRPEHIGKLDELIAEAQALREELSQSSPREIPTLKTIDVMPVVPKPLPS